MKKQIRNLFKNKNYLLDEPEVEELIEYCEHLQDEVVELNYLQNQNKEVVLKEMITDILKACNAMQKEQEEHKRFGYPPANFEEAILNLKKYIYDRCKDEKIWLE